MNTFVSTEKNQTRLVVRFPGIEFETLSPMIDRFGGPQLFGERLVRWFAEQDPILQTAIQGQIPATPDLMKLIFERLERRSPAVAGKIHPKTRSIDHRGMEAAKTDPDAPRRGKK